MGHPCCGPDQPDRAPGAEPWLTSARESTTWSARRSTTCAGLALAGSGYSGVDTGASTRRALTAGPPPARGLSGGPHALDLRHGIDSDSVYLTHEAMPGMPRRRTNGPIHPTPGRATPRGRVSPTRRMVSPREFGSHFCDPALYSLAAHEVGAPRW